jgi:hypothetical protein
MRSQRRAQSRAANAKAIGVCRRRARLLSRIRAEGLAGMGQWRVPREGRARRHTTDASGRATGRAGGEGRNGRRTPHQGHAQR